ncbi:MAG: FkbM family methyltransferase [Gammaproteobacteria bacterium]
MNISDLLRTLQPRQVDNSKRIRLGCSGDGGYVIMDHPNLIDTVLYSYGIEDNDSFDQHFHKKYNCEVRQYDFSISAPPKRDGFSFTQEGISHEKNHNCDTFESHIIRNVDQEKRIFLKMDVEGAEWLTFLHMPEHILLQCNQIAIEVHDLSGHGINTMYPKVSLEEKIAVMEKITKHFHCWNVHANNYASMFIVDGHKIPDVMEMTFINKNLHPGGQVANELFPTKYDQACHARMQDHVLDFWPFYSQTEIIAPKKPILKQKIARLKRSLSTRKWKYLRKRHAK